MTTVTTPLDSTPPSGAPIAEATAESVEVRKPLGPFFWICAGWVLFIVILAIIAPYLPLKSPTASPFLKIWGSPSATNWFGTDNQGRDIFSRVIFGSRVSIFVGFGAGTAGIAIGGLLGVFAGWRRGVADQALGVIMLIMYCIPGIIILIALRTFWPPVELWKLIVEIGILSFPLFFRVMRAATLSVATRDFVRIATLQGASTRRVVMRELLPNIFPLAMSYYVIGVAAIIVLEGSLSFLGLSISALTGPTWGNMIAQSSGYFPQSRWLVLFPCLDMCLFLLALNFIGDRLRNYFDVAEIKL